MKARKLKCEFCENPLGMDLKEPRFSWKLAGAGRGKAQSGYRIIVSEEETAVERGEGELWDTGKVEEGDNFGVEYEGRELESDRTYHWRVRVWDEKGERGAWSEPARFHTGLFRPEDWTADWIAAPKEIETAPLLRSQFVLERELEEAHAFVCGLGYYEMYLNGEKVGDQLLDPGTTDYGKRLLYETYDVTSQLREGENAVGATLGNGWYCPPEQNEEDSPLPLRRYGERPQLLLQLNLRFADGERRIVGSDNSWKCSSGPIKENSVWNGEIYDAREEREGWTEPSFDTSEWLPVQEAAAPGGKLVSQMMPPIRTEKVLRAESMEKVEGEDAYLFDFGENITGWPMLTVSGEQGKEVRLRTAEATVRDMARMKEEEEEGLPQKIDPRPNRSARATDVYVLKGAKEENYEPRFTYHGFRYVQVEGFPGRPAPEDVKARVLHTDVERAGDFSCSEDLFNKIHRNTLRGQLGNLFSIPTDCPQRDERMGWLGDAHLTAEEAMENFDMASFYHKWLDDLADAQGEDGALPDVAPLHWDLHPGTPAWQVAYPLITWYTYLYYGDERILKRHFGGLKKFLDYMKGLAEDGVIEEGRGDWVPPKYTDPQDDSIPLTSTGYFFLTAKIVAQAAEVLGYGEKAKRYADLSEEIKEAFNREFFNEETESYGESQTKNAFPLYLGLAPKEKEGAVLENLLSSIEEKEGHIWAGILGTKALVNALPAQGKGEVLYEMARKRDFPGWGYMIEKGATTLWERWGGYRFLGPEMNSLNHIMFGSIEEFFYGELAGIHPPTRPGTAAGYGRVQIAPKPFGELTSAKGKMDTIRGQIVSDWHLSDDNFSLTVALPPGVTGEITLPLQELGWEEIVVEEGERTIWENGSFQEGAEGVTGGKKEESQLIFQLGSGEYHFRLSPVS